jgi:hypothetical protein
MDKNVSIVRVDTRHYRVIARENWGLTKEQMKGMHVHHRIKRCDGGTNDPSNLYVCSPSFHRWIWHDGEEFIEWAIEGGKKAAQKTSRLVHVEKNKEGKSKHAMKMAEESHKVKNVEGKSVNAVKSGKKGLEKMHAEKDEFGRSILGVRNAERLHAEKDEFGRSIVAMRVSEKTHAKKDQLGRSISAMNMIEKTHAEKDEKGRSKHAMKRVEEMNSQVWESTEDGFRSTAGAVAKHNKAKGWDPNARVKIK